MAYKLPATTLTVRSITETGTGSNMELTEESLLKLAESGESQVHLKGHDVVFENNTFEVKVLIESFERADTNIMKGTIYVPGNGELKSEHRTLFVNLADNVIKIGLRESK